MRVKVGLDEWLAADPKQTDLITDGLLGCVAVGLTGKDRIALTHVYDEAKDEALWPSYQEKLDEALQASRLGEPKDIRAVLVYSDPTSGLLCDRIEDWLSQRGIHSERRMDDGCRVCAVKQDAVVRDKSADQQSSDYSYGYRTTIEDALPVERFALSAKAGAATKALQDPDTPVPVAKPILLTDASHPAHRLFASVLGQIDGLAPSMFTKSPYWKNEVAAALTVKCLDAGIRDGVEKLAYGKDDTDTVFALVGGQEGARHDLCANVFELGEDYLPVASELARVKSSELGMQPGLPVEHAQTQQGGQSKGM
jgi:hypothetical protein